MNWQYLDSEDTLLSLINQSHSDNFPGVFLFKHSSRCSISSMALKRFEDALKNVSIPSYLLKVIENRNISNLVSSNFNVTHQSPQVLWIKNGVCIENASHTDISANWIKRCIEK